MLWRRPTLCHWWQKDLVVCWQSLILLACRVRERLSLEKKNAKAYVVMKTSSVSGGIYCAVLFCSPRKIWPRLWKERGQSSGLILGSYLGRYPNAERNLVESTFTRELAGHKDPCLDTSTKHSNMPREIIYSSRSMMGSIYQRVQIHPRMAIMPQHSATQHS